VSPPEQALNQAQQKHREEVKELMDERCAVQACVITARAAQTFIHINTCIPAIRRNM